VWQKQGESAVWGKKDLRVGQTQKWKPANRKRRGGSRRLSTANTPEKTAWVKDAQEYGGGREKFVEGKPAKAERRRGRVIGKKRRTKGARCF